MAETEVSLNELAKRGDLRQLEDCWLSAIETANAQDRDLLEALDTLTRNGRGPEATALGSMWLATAKENAEPADTLVLAREIVLCCNDNDEMRQELLALYQEVYADRPEIERLIDASGLTGSKSPRRALRTLDICLRLEVGTHLLARSDEHVARVTSVDKDACEYTIAAKRGQETLDADTLALNYDPVDDNDFRVLTKLYPDKVTETLNSDPVSLITGLLKGHGGRIDSDQLQHMLSPRYITDKAWSAWWSKARTQLKRSHNVVLEGRNPVVLTYHAGGRTLAEETQPQWQAAESPAQRLAVIETYFRESKARQSKINASMVKRMHRDLLGRIQTARAGAPAEALAEALVIDRLIEGAELPEGKNAPAREILADSEDLPALLRLARENSLYLQAIKHIKTLHPDDWPQIYAELLPTAPINGCEAIARKLIEADKTDLLEEAAQQTLSDFTEHLDAVCWLWQGKAAANLQPIPPRTLLARMLQHLGELALGEHVSQNVRRDARIKTRAALSSGKYVRFQQVIQEMEPGLASTVKRTIQRLDGLGQTVHVTLIKIIDETHPELIVTKKQIDPWFDDAVLFTTLQGMQNRERELNHLVNVKMKENAKAIGDAAAHGDLSENSEYKFALEERDLLRSRVAMIQNELSLARLITASDVSTDAVDIGTRVTLVGVHDGSRKELTILGPFEADMEKAIYNYRAPLCHKLKGLTVTDTVALDLEDQEQEYRVEAITNALAR